MEESPKVPVPELQDETLSKREYSLANAAFFETIEFRNTEASIVPHSLENELTDSVDQSTTGHGNGEYTGEEWLTYNAVATLTGRTHHKVAKIAEEQRALNPDLVRGYEKNHRKECAPELVRFIVRQLGPRKHAPPNFRRVHKVAEEFGMDTEDLVSLIDAQQPEDDQTGMFHANPRNEDLSLHVTEDVLETIRPECEKYRWLTPRAVARELKETRERTTALLRELETSHPEFFAYFPGKDSQLRISPELIPELRLASEGKTRLDSSQWPSVTAIAKEIDADRDAIKRLAAPIIIEHPDWAKEEIDGGGNITERYSAELAEMIVQSAAPTPPEGWLSYDAMAAQIGVPRSSLFAKIVEQVVSGNGEVVGLYRSNRGLEGSPHYSSEVAARIDEVYKANRSKEEAVNNGRAEQERLRRETVDFLSDVEKGESFEAQEFRKLIALFGGEGAIDLLYKMHPECRKIPVPYVKSIIPDYLGDFLITRGDLDLDRLEAAVMLLSDTNLKDRLTEVIKSDCLRFYNQLKQAGLAIDDLDIILEHIGDLRTETVDYSTEELSVVLDEVENYYRSLFKDVHKPDCLVDELNPGRSFPDLSQRINMHEIATKRRMLIADEMGVGKSASAILTKEYLGVGLAVIIAPSNVVNTWRDYLSDKIVNGEKVGYFKPGQSPRVLIVENPESLKGISSGDYEYIVISQERLNSRYAESLMNLDYGMLVVDEVHKMKNLMTGKRAENLVRLAEGIDEDNGYLALLSGTPIPNKVDDIATVLKLLYPERFKELSNKELTGQILNGDALDLRSLLVPRMQMKSLAESVKMPNLKETIQYIDLTPEERDMYEVLLDEDEITASQKIQILRKFCLHPELLEATPNINGSKIREVGLALRETFVDKDKVVMFVNGYVEGVIRGKTIVEGLGLSDDIEVFAIEGEVDKDTRIAIQQELQTSNRKMLVLVSGQTADVGVDFSGAQEVDFYNEPWTEYDKKQQLGRVYRPGLESDLVSRTFIVRGTIEEGIHSYIRSKYIAVEKLLRGIPISDLEREMLKSSEKDQNDPIQEVSPELAEHYFSNWDRLTKFFGYSKELGEDNFKRFLGKHGKGYADSYRYVGGRSYQANASRLSGTILDRFAKQKRQDPVSLRILDIASGPEMLRKFISDELSDSIISVDINEHHFTENGQNRAVGSFLKLPIADSSIDYANLSLALHYTNFVPSRGKYERIKVLQEINRVLSVGGRVVISLMNTRDFKDESAFREAVTRLGFKIIEQFTGRTEDGAHFRTRLFTLEKTHNGPRNIEEAVKQLGPSLIKGFKFTKNKAKLRDSRKIATSFSIEGQQGIRTIFNQGDMVTLEEERTTLREMTKLYKKYSSVKEIPREEIEALGFSRIFNGKSYVLYRRLIAGSGSVVLR